MELAGYNVAGGLTPACESVLMLPAMPGMWRRAAFRVMMFAPERHRAGHLPQGRTGRQDCVQIFAIIIDDQGVAAAPETVGATARACVSRRASGRSRPAAVTRKGAP
jgi:hypothetical protein